MYVSTRIYTYVRVSKCPGTAQVSAPLRGPTPAPAQTSGGLGGGRQVSYKERPPPATCRH